MAVGDVKFGNVAASGHIQGTAADIFIRSGFAPQWVLITNMDSATQLFWTQTMDPGTGILIGASSGPSVSLTNISGANTLGRIYVGPITGTFQAGELVTDTSGNTATYSGSGVDPAGVNYLEFSDWVG